jgi:hypothetical protein
MTQFSSVISGNVGKSSHPTGVGVTVTLVRANNPVDQASTTTDGGGNWTVTLPSHAVGDDRDEIDVDYTDAAGSPGSAPTPNHQVILTGNGGTAAAEAGWTGWTDLDNGQFTVVISGPGQKPQTILLWPRLR